MEHPNGFNQTILQFNQISKKPFFGFIGTISHTLFGTLYKDDGKIYSDKISQLEKKQA